MPLITPKVLIPQFPLTRLVPSRPAGELFDGSTLERWLAIEPSNLIEFLPLNEGSGSVIRNAAPSGSGYNGAYTGVTWDGTLSPIGEPVPLWDGTSDFGNLWTAALAAAFNGAEGTIALWAKVSAAGVWADGANRRLITLQSDTSNRVFILKTTVNTIQCTYTASTTAKNVASAAQTTTDWQSVALTWNKAADEVKAYLNGAQVGTTQTTLGVWGGALAATTTNIGSVDTTPTQVWSGYLSNVGIWSKALTAAQIASLATP